MIAYIGPGPSAHSYDGISRQWNIYSNSAYIQSLEKGKLNFEREELTANDRFNEYVMTALRRREGIDLAFLKENFGEHKSRLFEKAAMKFLNDDLLVTRAQNIRLTRSGKLIADRIICDLFETD